MKKWITNGTFSDYFTTAVRTGGSGMGGISMLLIPRSAGLSTKKVQLRTRGKQVAHLCERCQSKPSFLLLVDQDSVQWKRWYSLHYLRQSQGTCWQFAWQREPGALK